MLFQALFVFRVLSPIFFCLLLCTLAQPAELITVTGFFRRFRDQMLDDSICIKLYGVGVRKISCNTRNKVPMVFMNSRNGIRAGHNASVMDKSVGIVVIRSKNGDQIRLHSVKQICQFPKPLVCLVICFLAAYTECTIRLRDAIVCLNLNGSEFIKQVHPKFPHFHLTPKAFL